MSRGTIGLVSTLKPNLVGHWKFQEGPGNTVQDYSGSGHHGRIFGAKYVSNRTGNNSALQFNGINSYIQIPNYNNNADNQIKNLTFLINFIANRVGNGGINGYSCTIASHVINDSTNGWWIEWRNDGTLELGTFVSGVYTPFVIHNGFIDLTSWHIIKGNIQSNESVKVYLDDNLKVDSKIGNWQDSLISDFIVGKGTADNTNNPNSVNQFYGGIIGEILIFNNVQ